MTDIPSAVSAGWERLVAVQAGDEEQQRLGRLFVTLMVISLGIVTALSAMFLSMQPLGLVSPRLSWIAAAFPIFFFPLAIVCIVGAHRGYLRSMIQIYIWLNFIGIGIAAWVWDGVVSPAWMLFFWAVTIAGILLRPATALWLTGVVAGYFGFMLLLTLLGIYSPLLTFGIAGRAYVEIGIVLIILASTVGAPTYLNMTSLRNALKKLRAEIADRKRTEAYLQQSEERYRNVFKHAGDIIFTMSDDGAYISLSPSFEKLTGWPAQEWVGKVFSPLVAEADVPRAFELLRRTLRGESIDPFELAVHKKGGGYFAGEFNVVRIKLGDEMVLLGICRDISERKRIEERIRKLNEELEIKVQERTKQLVETQEELVRKEKLAVLGQVAGSVGHELRNPLGVMSNAVYFLQTMLIGADETTKEYLNIIKDEIAGSERIVSDLIDAARTKPPRAETISVRRLIEQALQKCSIPPSVTVKLDVPDTLPLLHVDARQMQKVFRNLITNAVEAMPEGGALEIGGVENKADTTVTVSVRDSGCGIAPEVIEKIFHPPFTTKARGIGLGLAVVGNLTKANGGTVKVKSEVGKGSVVSITLPSEAGAASDTPGDSVSDQQKRVSQP